MTKLWKDNKNIFSEKNDYLIESFVNGIEYIDNNGELYPIIKIATKENL